MSRWIVFSDTSSSPASFRQLGNFRAWSCACSCIMRASGGRENCSPTAPLPAGVRFGRAWVTIGRTMSDLLSVAAAAASKRNRSGTREKVIWSDTFCPNACDMVLASVPKSRSLSSYQQSSRAACRCDGAGVAASAGRPICGRGGGDPDARSGTLADPAARVTSGHLRQRLFPLSAKIRRRPDGHGVARSSRRPLLRARKSDLAHHEACSRSWPFGPSLRRSAALPRTATPRAAPLPTRGKNCQTLSTNISPSDRAWFSIGNEQPKSTGRPSFGGI